MTGDRMDGAKPAGGPTQAPAAARRADAGSREPLPPAHILLVEDNAGDIRLTQEALREGRIESRLSFVRDGEEALAFLRRLPPHQAAPSPDLVLLDLNLPRMDGRELLGAIKQDPELRRTPVIVLTTSNARQDVLKAFELGANCYIVKPVMLDRFVDVICAVEAFWLGSATLPSRI